MDDHARYPHEDYSKMEKKDRSDTEQLESQIKGVSASIDRHQACIDAGDNPTLHEREIAKQRKELRETVKALHLLRLDLGDLMLRKDAVAKAMKIAPELLRVSREVFSDVPDINKRLETLAGELVVVISEIFGLPAIDVYPDDPAAEAAFHAAFKAQTESGDAGLLAHRESIVANIDAQLSKLAEERAVTLEDIAKLKSHMQKPAPDAKVPTTEEAPAPPAQRYHPGFGMG
jgi:hypothetical protein